MKKLGTDGLMAFYSTAYFGLFSILVIISINLSLVLQAATVIKLNVHKQ